MSDRHIVLPNGTIGSLARQPQPRTKARKDQAGQTSAGSGSGDTTGDRRIVVTLKAATEARFI